MSPALAGALAYGVLITAFAVFVMHLLDEANKANRRLAKRLHPSRPTLTILQSRPRRVPAQRDGSAS